MKSKYTMQGGGAILDNRLSRIKIRQTSTNFWRKISYHKWIAPQVDRCERSHVLQSQIRIPMCNPRTIINSIKPIKTTSLLKDFMFGQKPAEVTLVILVL